MGGLISTIVSTEDRPYEHNSSPTLSYPGKSGASSTKNMKNNCITTNNNKALFNRMIMHKSNSAPSSPIFSKPSRRSSSKPVALAFSEKYSYCINGSQKSFFMDVPQEVIVYILGFLDEKDLCSVGRGM